uniref:Histidine-containing phosphotransfer protein n=1 Tax=Salix viminalis TaxID=40686 RepID=A0A6N2LGJ4_SALVM
MASTPIRQQLSIMRQSLFDEGLLDHEQVSYLETLENEDDPDFIENVFTLFLRDSTRYIDSIEKALETSPIDYPIMERMMYRLKGSSASIGASKINGKISTLRKKFHDGDMESGKASLQKLKAEHANFKEKLVVYVGMLKQAKLSEY